MTHGMVPHIGNFKKWQNHSSGKQISGCLGMGIGVGCVLMANGHEASF